MLHDHLVMLRYRDVQHLWSRQEGHCYSGEGLECSGLWFLEVSDPPVMVVCSGVHLTSYVTSGVISGINWVAGQHRPGKKSVAK